MIGNGLQPGCLDMRGCGWEQVPPKLQFQFQMSRSQCGVANRAKEETPRPPTPPRPAPKPPAASVAWIHDAWSY